MRPPDPPARPSPLPASPRPVTPPQESSCHGPGLNHPHHLNHALVPHEPGTGEPGTVHAGPRAAGLAEPRSGTRHDPLPPEGRAGALPGQGRRGGARRPHRPAHPHHTPARPAPPAPALRKKGGPPRD